MTRSIFKNVLPALTIFFIGLYAALFAVDGLFFSGNKTAVEMSRIEPAVGSSFEEVGNITPPSMDELESYEDAEAAFDEAFELEDRLMDNLQTIEPDGAASIDVQAH